ncbi:MAG: hypothetical protein NZ518_05345 [Dehalococcoidia bacterium]|nr:hypothetical protein [Dehalococcoidia bacterium]
MGAQEVGAMNGTIRWRARRIGNGWEGEAEVRLPAVPGGAIRTTARGQTKADAVARTLSALEVVERSPMMRALLPDQARAAIRAGATIARGVARLFRQRRGAVRGLADAMAREGVSVQCVRLARALGA